MWDVVVTVTLMGFGAFVMLFMGALLIWVLYRLQNGVDDE
jgi:hypothetical protein